MKRPNIYSKPLEGIRTENYHPADLNGQYAKDLNKYIDHLEIEVKKLKKEAVEHYKVVYINYESKSFQWNNGLFAIISKKDNILNMCKIVDGKPQVNDDGTLMITCTGAGNRGIIETNLTFKHL